MARVYNFSAGPSMLPEAVLKTAQAELLDYHGSGMSVMEMSHRSKWFDEIITNAWDITGDLFRSKLSITCFCLIFFNMNRCINIVLYQFFT